jgi:WD40 repeat protein
MIIDGSMLITGSDDGTIRLWELTSFTPKGLVGDHGRIDRTIEEAKLAPPLPPI